MLLREKSHPKWTAFTTVPNSIQDQRVSAHLDLSILGNLQAGSSGDLPLAGHKAEAPSLEKI